MIQDFSFLFIIRVYYNVFTIFYNHSVVSIDYREFELFYYSKELDTNLRNIEWTESVSCSSIRYNARSDFYIEFEGNAML